MSHMIYIIGPILITVSLNFVQSSSYNENFKVKSNFLLNVSKSVSLNSIVTNTGLQTEFNSMM